MTVERLRVLAITQIWPNALEPLSSPFNRQQFRALAKRADLTVLAAISHLPGARLLGRPERTAKLAALPERDVIDGIETVYMRQLYVPKYGVPVAVPLYLASLAPYAAQVRACDVVLGTWAYPDGCAAVLFARALGKPVVVKVHGTDLNYVTKLPSARAVARRTLPRADATVTVSRALGDELAGLGVPRDRIHLVANGVDDAVFTPRSKAEARRTLGTPVEGKVVLFVGRLEPQKGTGELLAAWPEVRRQVPDARLVLVGDGMSRPQVEAACGADPSIVAPGPKPLLEVARWMSACDVFTLPSWMEGTPNVVLEALASGRPAVASDVGGIPDVLRDPRSGLVVPAKDAAALAAGLVQALTTSWDPASVRATGPGTWDESGAALYDVLRASLRTSGTRR